MRHSPTSPEHAWATRGAQVLFVSDGEEDVRILTEQLAQNFPNLRATGDPEQARRWVLESAPDILLLCFGTTTAAGAFARSLTAEDLATHTPFSSLLLCLSTQVREAHDLAVSGVVDDYFMYKPLFDVRGLAFRIDKVLSPTLVPRVARETERLEAQLARLGLAVPAEPSPVAESDEDIGEDEHGGEDQPADDGLPAAESDAAEARILVFDDDPLIGELVEFVLAEQGYEVITRRAAREWRADMLRHEPKLVLLDIGLPEVDGLEVLREMKKETRLRHIPVIMLTGNRSPTTVRTSVDAGAVDYVAKPFKLETLVSKVARALERSRAELASQELTTLMHGDLL